jgi:hypothetical protein
MLLLQVANDPRYSLLTRRAVMAVAVILLTLSLKIVVYTTVLTCSSVMRLHNCRRMRQSFDSVVVASRTHVTMMALCPADIT